ncbi:uncharacterized protein LOC120265429 [Dioscorea cayenensis subsp. rotundata]|uniref:Uncharacterized protein LOC120265429 n=1 Tax=Dioscorea cayennensis subsp. rotundata TaxID=55577 RepID=A0AB40BP96_DIOCR|nr:uncharacterized protein LOC120265429 [Dioscorea cayenensis subsp. rotundata]
MGTESKFNCGNCQLHSSFRPTPNEIDLKSCHLKSKSLFINLSALQLSVLDVLKQILFGSSLVNIELFPSAVLALSCNFSITFGFQTSTAMAPSKNMHEAPTKVHF